MVTVLVEKDFLGWIVVEAEQDSAIPHPLEYTLTTRKYINEKLLLNTN